MANIVINDLTENTDLDRKAMRTITGGKSSQRLGVTARPTSTFNNPLSFSPVRLTPGSGQFGNW